MEDDSTMQINREGENSLVNKIGPQFFLLLLPALCAFTVIFLGDRLIFSDLAFLFGTILVIEAIYFTFWGWVDKESNSNSEKMEDSPMKEEWRLECPNCEKRFFVQISSEDAGEDITCRHCSFVGSMDWEKINI